MNHFETEDDIEEKEELRSNIDSRDSFIMGVLEINDDFINTKMGKQFRNDNIKSQYCKDNNIKLIRIPYWEYDNINEILDKELNLE